MSSIIRMVILLFAMFIGYIMGQSDSYSSYIAITRDSMFASCMQSEARVSNNYYEKVSFCKDVTNKNLKFIFGEDDIAGFLLQ